MQKYIYCLISGLMAALIATASFADNTIDRIAAIVNDDIIMQSELDKRVGIAKQQFALMNTTIPGDNILVEQVLERLIEEHLILQQAEVMGIRIDDQALNQAIISIAQQNNTDLAGFRQMLEADNTDYIEFREDLRKDMLMNQVQQQRVGYNIMINDAEINRLLNEVQAQNPENNQYRVGHILISLPRNPSSEQVQAAEKKAADAIAALTESDDFHQVALKYSDNSNVLEQADLGWRTQTQLPSLFADVVPELTVSEVAEPLRNNSGLHIVQLLEVRQQMPENVQREQAREYLYQQKMQEALQAWLIQLRDTAHIEVKA